MKIKEIFKDIVDDIDHSSDSYTDMYESMGSTPWDARRNGYDIGFFTTLFPNILGFVFGLAITKLLGMGGAAYLIFGAIGAVGLGVLNSVYRQGIAIRYAIIRHIIIVLGIALVYGLVCLIEK